MKFGVAIVPHDLKETAVSAKLAEDLGSIMWAFPIRSHCGGSFI